MSKDVTKSYSKGKGTSTSKTDKSSLEAERAARAQPIEEAIPTEFRHLLSGNVIDLSGASTFYQKKAAAVEVLEGFVEPLPNNSYRLKNGFDLWYRRSLRGYCQRNWETPSNTLAHALFELGVYWARIQYGQLPKNVEHYTQFLRDPWEGVNEELKNLLKSRSLSMPTFHCAVLANNTVVDANWLEPIENPLEISLDFALSLREPPAMSIKVRGRPAAELMSWWMRYDGLGGERAHKEHEELRLKAITLLRSIVQNLETHMGLRNEQGRPPKNLGEVAAYAIDHQGKSAWAATRALCEEKQSDVQHLCKDSCFDRIRQARKNYYRQLSQQLKDLVFVNRKQMS